jgi:SAM-dependent methyltransferase
MEILMADLACRLCGSLQIAACLILKRVPRNIQRLLKVDQLSEDRPVRLEILQCKCCDFVQLPPVLEGDYYDDYLMTASHSNQMQSFQADQASGFISRFDLGGKKVIDVGCGDGSYLLHLTAAGAEASGIEPSLKSRLAAKRGFKVEAGYVTALSELAGAPFDGFVTRQVLEHVPDIHDFLQGIRRNLKPGAFGLIEVPRLEKALEDRRYYDFFPDHVNYFSERTLRLALEINGFEVLETSAGMFEEYNIAYVQLPHSQGMRELQDTVDSLSREIEAFIGAHVAKGEIVAIWGAGGKGLSVMAAADVSGASFLVDADPHKRDLYSPLSHLRVQDPEVFKQSRIDAVIVTAMAYRKEIVDRLRGELGFKGTVAVLGRSLEIVR